MSANAVLALHLSSLVVRFIKAEEACSPDAVHSDAAHRGTYQHPSLLQHRFQKTGSIIASTEEACCGGIFVDDRCWLLGEAGQNCDAVCNSRSLTYSFAAPTEDLTPRLLGRDLSNGRQSPWLFVECYVPKDDRYHPMNVNAWGVPDKTRPADLSESGQYSYDTCRLACPCAASSQESPLPTSPATLEMPSTSPGQGIALPSSVISCTGVEKNDRCWYLSEVGDSCDKTCGLHGPNCSFQFASPAPVDVTPALVGHVPSVKQNPWLFAECYVPSEDRYHPANPNAWGVPEKTPTDELAEVGQHSYPSCRLACSCQGTCMRPSAPPSPNPSLPGSSTGGLSGTGLIPLPKCRDGMGLSANGKCWYLSSPGASCDSTCEARNLTYSFAAPAEDMTPQLLGRLPTSKQDPWLFVECYVQSEDRYHTFNANAWGNPAKTPAADLEKPGQHSYPSCQLACPCATVAEAGLKPYIPPSLTSAPVTSSLPPATSGAECEGGRMANGRCWYLSDIGGNCDSTCAKRGCTYNWTAPPTGDMVQELLGHVPHTRQDPWLCVECYAPKEDRYHPYNPNAWGVPEKTPANEMSQTGQLSHDECRLSCPCDGTCFNSATMPGPRPTALPRPGAGPAPLDPAPERCSDGIGINTLSRCWYFSDVGKNCNSTCNAHGMNFLFAAPVDDIVPKILGRAPNTKQEPWTFLECYVPGDDRYHPYGTDMPKGLESILEDRMSGWSHDECQLSCPCVGGGPPVPVPPVPPLPPVTPSPMTTLDTTAPPSSAPGNCSGFAAAGKCWYLSDVSHSCDQTCNLHGPGCQFSFATSVQDLTPSLIGHAPHGRMDPWLFVECYVPQEDRYHPANPNAWGVPGKTPPNELDQVGKFSHQDCMLSCPCDGACLAAATAGSVLRVLGTMPGITADPWTWEKLVGIDGEQAKVAIQSVRPDLDVYTVPDSAALTMDMVNSRVRIFVDGAGQVVKAPLPG